MRRATLVLVGMLLIAAVGGLPGSSQASTTAAENEHAASVDGASLLPLLVLPPGAAQSSTEPAGDGGHLAAASQTEATPNLIDQHTWWIVPLPRAETIAFLRAHPPPGSKLTGSGQSGSGRLVVNGEDKVGDVEEEWQEFGFAPVAGTIARSSLLVTAVQLPDGSTGVRADAQVVWLTPRPPAEIVPPGSRLMRVSVLSEIPENRPDQRPFTVTSVRRIAAVVKLLNSLPAAQPGTLSCPSDLGNRVHLSFYTRSGSTPLSTASIDPEGCGGVSLVIRGRVEHELEGASELVKEIAQTIGVTIHTSPRRRHG